jgi:hypothetical protein
MNRIETINQIIDLHIEELSKVTDPILNDTKILTEILKAMLVLEQVKKLEGQRSSYDDETEEELELKLNGLGG